MWGRRVRTNVGEESVGAAYECGGESVGAAYECGGGECWSRVRTNVGEESVGAAYVRMWGRRVLELDMLLERSIKSSLKVHIWGCMD